MTLNLGKIHRLLGVCLLALAGCEPTRPPLTQLDQAGRAVEIARSAGAGTYAPLELRYAEERLAQSRSAQDKRDYTAALLLADEAQANSDLAIAKSRLGKAREKVEARTRENAQLRQDTGGDATSGAQR